MYLSFREEFDLPISVIFPYFKSPSEWAKLYGVMKPTKILKDDWYAIPLQMFPLFEYITPHGLWLFSSLFEKQFMEKQFERIWSLGWKRIRKTKEKDIYENQTSS